ncbi:hypothetical protein CQW23_34164 [Capsicum baccatum]|uniref:Uncharacterized protein n=1 Tax=Capsicum baccatum TaxID=33114 RepID=A0A2G2UZM3_CAPBA|nr:hypothetical protein CQW23_34164 [Capsicum baccatum]
MNGEVRWYVSSRFSFTLSLVGLVFIIDCITYICVDGVMVLDEFEGYINFMMMPDKSRGYMDDMMMPGDSKGYTDVMMVPNLFGGYNDDMMMPDNFVGYVDDIMLPGNSKGYIDDVMIPDKFKGYTDDIYVVWDAVMDSLLYVLLGVLPDGMGHRGNFGQRAIQPK